MTNRQPMNESQQSQSAQWILEPGEVRSLRIGPGPRLLRVAEGSVWLTATGELELPAEDVWLGAGDSVALEDHAEVVLEGWPQASFQLLVPPCKGSDRRPLISAWFSSLRAAA